MPARAVRELSSRSAASASFFSATFFLRPNPARLLCSAVVMGLVAPHACAASPGLTLVHFSAQLEPCLTHKNTLHTLTPPEHGLHESAPPIPQKALKLS
jgi:hypothetical protein